MFEPMNQLERFYTTRGGNIQFYRGYLSDPKYFGSFVQPDVFPLSELNQKKCLILLGPQNFGKTSDTKKAYESINLENPDQYIWQDLADCYSQEDLRSAIFSNKKFTNCINQGKDIFLFLDHWEIGMSNFNNKLLGLFLRELEKYKGSLDKIFIRIICRRSEWHKNFEDKLKNLYTAVDVYEIAPLREIDVAYLTEKAGVSNIDKFLTQVRELHLTPLAARPDTLEVLINHYKSNEIEAEVLFEKCCLLLCEEDVLGNPSMEMNMSSSPIERLEIAKRIAAYTVFCNKTNIFTQIDRGQLVATDITVNELSGNIEEIQGNKVPVDELKVRETLKTGLFESSGEERVRWGNPFYQNYLAAKYLVSRNIDDTQIINLLTMDHPITKEKRISPILYGVAGWLAILKESLFELITEIDASVILRSKVQIPKGNIRKKLFNKLVRANEKNIWSVLDLDVSAWYGQLEHSGLEKQLDNIIKDSNADVSSKIMAIDIAIACEYINLNNSILNLVLDTKENKNLRSRGFYAMKNYYPNDNILLDACKAFEDDLETPEEISIQTDYENQIVTEILGKDETEKFQMSLSSSSELEKLFNNIIKLTNLEAIEMKEKIITNLATENSDSAFDMLANLLKKYRKDEMIKQYYPIAEQKYLSRKWEVSLLPSHISKMVINENSRIINSESHLMDIVIESLDRFQKYLLGKTPGAVYLWDVWDDKIKPKDEESFSDFIKLFLERDLMEKGVIINREVEIRRHKFNKKKGERTDILVETFVKTGQKKEKFISLIIEVKGCWNNDLKTDLENKLVNRYLNNYTSNHGLYLVGWFNCDSWFKSEGDTSRKKKTPRMKIEKARDLFAKQADDNSNTQRTIKSVVLDVGLH